MTTFVQLSDENEPIVDLAVLLDSILKIKQKKGKTGGKETESKPDTEEADEESDKEEKDEEGEKEEGEKEEGEKGDKGEDGSEEEEAEKPPKKGKAKKKEKPKESKEEEESAWITLAKEGRPLNFLEQVFVPNLAQIFDSNPTEAEAAWEIATSILEHIIEHEVNEEDEEPAVDEATLTAARKLVIRLGTLLSTPNDDDKKSSQTVSLKLKCLLTLYNTFKSNPIPQQLFIQVLRYAIWSENGNLLVNSLSEIEQTIRTGWKPKLPELREIYLLLSQIFAQANRPSETQKYRLAYLKTFEPGKDGKELEQAADIAVAAIVTAISTSNSVHYQILSNLKVISYLSTHKDHAKAVRLLTIFAKENLESYNKFYSENAAYVKKIGLDHDANVKQMRSLTICSLGVNQESVSYETLMKTLQVGDEIALEEAVIDAVQQEKIEAKIDQESQQVLIERVSARVFEDTQWKQIGEKLEAWKQELGRALQSLQHAQQPSSTLSQPQSRSRAS